MALPKRLFHRHIVADSPVAGFLVDAYLFELGSAASGSEPIFFMASIAPSQHEIRPVIVRLEPFSQKCGHDGAYAAVPEDP